MAPKLIDQFHSNSETFIKVFFFTFYVRVSVPPCGFRGGRNGVWVGFSWGFSRFPLPQISFHHFSTLISSISFHFISPCDGASGVVGRHPCYSRTYNIGASTHLIPRPTLCWTRVEDIYFMFYHRFDRLSIVVQFANFGK